MSDSVIYASPMPGEMDGNEPDLVDESQFEVDQIPATDIDDGGLSV